MSDARRSQTRAILAFVAVVCSLGAAFGACTNFQRENGESCLKDEDCLSGYCVAQQCGTPVAVLNGNSYEDASAASNDTGTTPETSTPGTDSSSSSDSATSDSGTGDAGSDGPAAQDEAGIDANGEDALNAIDAADANDGSNDAPEMDASDDATDSGVIFDANPDAEDAQDAFNVTARRSFVV